jgi:hypothetical protein
VEQQDGKAPGPFREAADKNTDKMLFRGRKREKFLCIFSPDSAMMESVFFVFIIS